MPCRLEFFLLPSSTRIDPVSSISFHSLDTLSPRQEDRPVIGGDWTGYTSDVVDVCSRTLGHLVQDVADKLGGLFAVQRHLDDERVRQELGVLGAQFHFFDETGKTQIWNLKRSREVHLTKPSTLHNVTNNTVYVFQITIEFTIERTMNTNIKPFPTISISRSRWNYSMKYACNDCGNYKTQLRLSIIVHVTTSPITGYWSLQNVSDNRKASCKILTLPKKERHSSEETWGSWLSQNCHKWTIDHIHLHSPSPIINHRPP